MPLSLSNRPPGPSSSPYLTGHQNTHQQTQVPGLCRQHRPSLTNPAESQARDKLERPPKGSLERRTLPWIPSSRQSKIWPNADNGSCQEADIFMSGARCRKALTKPGRARVPAAPGAPLTNSNRPSSLSERRTRVARRLVAFGRCARRDFREPDSGSGSP